MKKGLIDIQIKTADLKTLQDIEAKMQKINEQQKKLKENSNKTSEQYQKNAVSVKKLKQEHTNLQREVIKQNQATKANINTIGGVNKKLAELRQRIQGVAFGTPQFKQMSGQIRDLQNKQQAFNTSIGKSGNFVKSMKTSFVSSFKSMATSMIGVTAAFSLIITQLKRAVQVNGEFEKGIMNTLGLLDAADKKAYKGILEEGALDLMVKYGLTVEDVNKAMFDTISAGVEAGDAIEFMEASAQLAVAGNSDLSSAITGTTKIMNAYNLEASESQAINEALFKGQVKGQMTVQELSEAIGRTTSAASKADIGYEELIATFAVLSKRLKNTDETATAINATISALIKPSEQAKAAFEELGIETGITALKQDGLLTKLTEIVNATEDNDDVLTDLIPNIRALAGVGAFTEETLREYDETLKYVTEDSEAAATMQAALADNLKTQSREMSQLSAEWDKFLIGLGKSDTMLGKIWGAQRLQWKKYLEFLNLASEKSGEFFDGHAKDISGAGGEWEELTSGVDEFSKKLEELEIKRKERAAAAKAEREAEEAEKEQKKITEEEEKEEKSVWDEIAKESEERLIALQKRYDDEKAMEIREEEGRLKRKEAAAIRRQKQEEKEKNEFIKIQQEKYQVATQLGEEMGMAVAGAMFDANSSIEDVFRAVLGTMFDFLQAQVPVWTAQILGYSLATPDSILTLGAAGIAKAAAITAILTVAVQGAKAMVMGFAEGGRIPENLGLAINRVNGDNRLITAKTGEVILNKNQQAMLGGASTFKSIGVPGFAQGGAVGMPSINGATFDYELFAETLAAKINDKPVYILQNEINAGLEESNQIAQIRNA